VLEIRTSAWYDERELSLEYPAEWDVEVHRPRTPAPLSDDEIAAALASPVGAPALREIARDASRPVIIVDDLTRPTPAHRVLPPLLRELSAAGCPPERVTVILATGSHKRIPVDAAARKVGPDVAASCRLLIHDGFGKTVNMGRTSFGTRVLVNPEVAAGDLVLGVGGVYPQHSTGFGGGAKLAIGVLGKQSIIRLHYRHESVGGSYRIENDFRSDLGEAARLIGLRWTVNVHVDAARRPVRVVSGDHESYYDKAVEFSREIYTAPPPGDADVVIANAYPSDVSLTFARSKGMIPLAYATHTASRVVVAGCPEGAGLHGVFPFVGGSRFAQQLHLTRVIRHRPAYAADRIGRRIRRAATGRTGRSPSLAPRLPVSLFAPGPTRSSLPDHIPGMQILHEWSDVVDRITAEQGAGRNLRVVVYPCAPLQVLEPGGDSGTHRSGE
jgi:nickel-dependent lactate racemase